MANNSLKKTIDYSNPSIEVNSMPNPIIAKNGAKEWYLNDQLHREDGPAIEYSDGTKKWYLNGKLHRTDGPAIEYPSGSKHWYLSDQLHREDGPALEYSDGSKHWYLNGKEYTEENYRLLQFANGIKLND